MTDIPLTMYEQQVSKQLVAWQKQLLKPPGFMEQTSKLLQTRMNQLIPEKAHETITAAVKTIMQAAVFGVDYMPRQEPLKDISLGLRDHRAEQVKAQYMKLAAAEGAGTGAGGLLLGLADFPLLITLKMKFLFELSHIYGHHTRDYRERLFTLYVFQLAFSSRDKRKMLLHRISNWSDHAKALPPADTYANHIHWRELQQEYRDTIDFRKMLQLLPGIGAVVGAWTNYHLLEELGETAMNCYRLRWMTEAKPSS